MKGKAPNTGGRWLLGLFLLVAMSLLPAPFAARASSWTQNLDQGIYGQAYSEAQQEEVRDELDGLEGRYKGVAGDVLSTLFGKFFVAVGDMVYRLLAPMGFDLNAIIYGRVGGSAYRTQGVSMFTYELADGNIYGIVSMAVFGLLRGIGAMAMVCVVMYRMVGFLWTNGGAKARENIKSSIQTFAILFLAMLLFPKFLDLALYVRDVILYAEMEYGSELIDAVGAGLNPDWAAAGNAGNATFDFFGTGGSYSLIGMFRTIVDQDMSFINSSMYLGSVAVQLYFGTVYVTMAFAMLVLVIIYPCCAVMELFDRTIMAQWVKQAVGILLNPILDSCLLLVPMMFMLYGCQGGHAGFALVALICCSCVIPAREIIRSILNIGRGMGLELSGLGTIMGAMRLAGSVTRGIGNLMAQTKMGMDSARQDDTMADLYADQLKRQELESENEQQMFEADVQMMLGPAGNVLDMGDVALEPADGAGTEAMDPGQRAQVRQERMENGLRALAIRKEQLAGEMRSGDVMSSQLGEQMAEIDRHTADLKAQKAAFDPQDMGHKESIRELDRQIAENGIDRQQLAAAREKIRTENGRRKEQMGTIDAIERRAHARRGMHMAGAGGGRSGTSQGDQDILDRYANVSNFDLPEFKNISLERKVELYRARAKQTRMRTAAFAGGSAAGSVALGSLWLAGASYGSPAVKAYAAAAGVEAGGAIGGAAGDFAGAQASKITVDMPALPTGRGTENEAAPTVWQGHGGRWLPLLQIEQKSRHRSNDYSDSDRIGTEYERRPTDYEPNWINPEEERQTERAQKEGRFRQYESAFDSMVTDPCQHEAMASDMKRAMREASASARQAFLAMKETGDIRTEQGQKEANQQLVEQALEVYGRLMADRVKVPDAEVLGEGFDYHEFDRYLENRFQQTSRSQMERYLHAKGILL